MPKTRNYETFSLIKSNRDINEGNVKKIMKSIQIKNLLEFRPILVDKEMRVIDGQHRLEAAKRLGLEIHYTVSTSAAKEDIWMLNEAQRNWNSTDYLKNYVVEGKEDYVKLQKFMDKHQFSLVNALTLFSGKPGGKDMRSFKQGNFKYPSDDLYISALTKLEYVRNIEEFLKVKLIGTKRFLKTTAYVNALSAFMNIKAVDMDEFMKKLNYKLDLIHPCTKASTYLKIFAAIYNWKNKNPIRLIDDEANDVILDEVNED